MSKLPDSDDLKIDLNEWFEQTQHNNDPWDIAGEDIKAAAEWIFVMLDEKSLERTSTLEDELNAMRNHPELVAAHTLAHTINRFEHTYRILKVEELRLLRSITDSLKVIASTAASSKGEGNE